MKTSKQKSLFEQPSGKHELFQIAELEVKYRPHVKSVERPIVSCSKDAYEILLQVWNENTVELYEEFYLVLLNRGNRVLGIRKISAGGIAGTIADPKLIFSYALTGLASGIMLAHNHPSGSLKPSTVDIDLTKKICTGAKLLDIQVLDHIIITTRSYVSFADEGWMNF